MSLLIWHDMTNKLMRAKFIVSTLDKVKNAKKPSLTNTLSLLLDWRSIDLSGAWEKEGHLHYKNFLRASKWGITCHTCSIIPKSLYCGLGLIPILSKGILRWWSRYGMWYLISKLSKSFYDESDLLFLVHHWGQLISDLRLVIVHIFERCAISAMNSKTILLNSSF